MSALQHIVAEKSSPFCNDLSLIDAFGLRHYVAVNEDETNGGPNYLRAWREAAGMSQEELALKARTSFQVIGHLERGRTQLSAKWLRRLAPVLNTTPGHLLDYHPDDLKNVTRGNVVSLLNIATDEQVEQIAEIARTITRRRSTGTDGD